MILRDGRLFIGNWGRGNVAIVDPRLKCIEATIELDRYERRNMGTQEIVIDRNPPGQMAIAAGKLFLGQVFGDTLIAIDLATQSIVKRIVIPGGGEGAISASADGRTVYFASNRAHQVFAVDTSTYAVEAFPFPDGGRGCLCVLAHPTKPLLYLGIQRRDARPGGPGPFPSGNSFLATFDTARKVYCGSLSLADVDNEDWGMPFHLLLDSEQARLFVGMFQSRLGLITVDEAGARILGATRFKRNKRNLHFDWVDPIAQAIHGEKLLSITGNNLELVVLNRRSLKVRSRHYLGNAPNGPTDVVVHGGEAIICYPQRGGLIFHHLTNADQTPQVGRPRGPRPKSDRQPPSSTTA